MKRYFMCWDYEAWMPSVQTHGTDTRESRDQLQETVVYDAPQAVQRPYHHGHLYANQLVLGSRLIPHDDVDLSR